MLSLLEGNFVKPGNSMKLKVANTIWQGWKSFEQYPKAAAGFSLLWLLLIGGAAFVWNLGSTGLIDETEPRFAEAARQMAETGDWITPYFNGHTRFDKPPLVYWLMAISYKLIGVNEWAARSPSALGAITLMGLGFYTLRSFGFPTSGAAKNRNRTRRQLWLSAWIGSALIALNPETLVWVHTGVSDMLLSGCMGGALLCFFMGYASQGKKDAGTRGRGDAETRKQGKQGKQGGNKPLPHSSLLTFPNSWYIAFYVLSALAVLTKGPVGVVLPGVIIAAFLIYLGKVREVLQEMGVVWGGLIFLVIALPWFVLVTLRNGSAYIESFFGYHNLERFTEVVNNHSAPWYFYFLVILVGFAPFSIYLPVAIARLRFWQRNFWCRQPRSAHLGLFALFWFAGIFVFFTIAVTKLPSYVLPLMPAAAILVALFWSEELTRTRSSKGNRGLLISGIVNVLFLLFLAGIFLYSPHLVGYDPAAPRLSELFAQSGIPLRGGIVWGATAVAAAVLLRQPQHWRWLGSVNLVGLIAFYIFVFTPTYLLIDQARQMPLRELAAIEREVRQPSEELLMVGYEKPSLVFYTQHPVKFFKQTSSAIAYLEKTSSSVLILSRPEKLEKIILKADKSESLAKQGAYQLIRVRY
jgi:4-amino-4-deoxy-L-arabinose transferase-like glycosyltransferase